MSIEVEYDMRTFPTTRAKDKINLQDFLNRTAMTYPLLGIAVITDSKFIVIEKHALKAIKFALEYNNLTGFAHMAIFFTIIQYAKKWERVESSGFWAYISEQLGYKYSEPLYTILTNSVKVACESCQRVFIKDSNGANSFYSTVLAHAIAPSKSFYALCDFLVQFYKNNLDSSVYTNDPAINRMIEVLRDRCKGTSIEQDDDIRGNVSGIQAGFKALLALRPAYMRVFLTRVLLQIDAILSGEVLDNKDYIDVLLTRWYMDKLAGPSVKRSAPNHKRTTDIAFSYGKIHLTYILNDSDEPAIRIPSIRLTDRNNPIVTVFSGDKSMYSKTIGVYGNDYTATSEETIIPLSDLCNVDFAHLRVELSLADNQIYSSNRSLWTTAVLFKDNKALTCRTVSEGNYIFFAQKTASVSFQGDIERHRRAYFAQLYNLYLQGDSSVYVNDTLLFCSRPPADSLRFRLPPSQAVYIVDDGSYPIYVRDKFAIIAIGQSNSLKVIASAQDGTILQVYKGEENVYKISLPTENGCYTISLSDAETGGILDEARFCIVGCLSVSFDEQYYLESSEEGILSLRIDEESVEVPLAGYEAKVEVTLNNNEIIVQIPRIKLLLDGLPLPKNAVWRGEISPSSKLLVICPNFLDVSISAGGRLLSKTDEPSGFEYAIGNMLQAYDGDDERQSIELLIAGNRHHMFDIIFKPCLIALPLFSLNGTTLTWVNSNSFVGDSRTELSLSFQPKSGSPVFIHTLQGTHILSSDFPEISERYVYKITGVTETAFGKNETFIGEGTVLFGNKSEVIFRNEILQITQVIIGGNNTEIKPFFIDGISFIGHENLGYTDLSGDYPHFKGKMYFNTRNGKRYFTDLNPVDIYLVNDVSCRLYISFDEGAGLFIDNSDEYLPELYKHADPPPKLARFFFIPDYFEYKFSKEAD